MFTAHYRALVRLAALLLSERVRPAATLWNLLPAGGVLQRGAAVDVLAPVWVIDPPEGAVVGRAFTVYVAGIVFEASARVTIRSSAGATVFDQRVQLSAGAPAQGTASVSVTLPAGQYVVSGYFLWARDGSVQGLDNHRFGVQ